MSVIKVTVLSGSTEVHSEIRRAFNAGIRASEGAVARIARAEHTYYHGGTPSRIHDLYSRVWNGDNGGSLIVNVERIV